MPSQPVPGTARSDTGSSPVRVTVVESQACHLCVDAQQALAEIAATYPVEVRVVDVRTDEGQALMQVHRAPMNPLVLLDGEFFSYGRLPRRKLTSLLTQRFPDRPGTERPTTRDGARHG